jgi:hypothetical protein
MATLYRVVASTVEKVDKGTMHRQSPTFLLHTDYQNIRNEADAEEVARHLINPTGNPDIEVNAYAIKWIDV